jgi:hypothetical protein
MLWTMEEILSTPMFPSQQPSAEAREEWFAPQGVGRRVESRPFFRGQSRPVSVMLDDRLG